MPKIGILTETPVIQHGRTDTKSASSRHPAFLSFSSSLSRMLSSCLNKLYWDCDYLHLVWAPRRGRSNEPHSVSTRAAVQGGGLKCVVWANKACKINKNAPSLGCRDHLSVTHRSISEVQHWWWWRGLAHSQCSSLGQALCRTVKTFHSRLGKPSIYGGGFMHEGMLSC